jgi:hypothetical protein
MKHLILLVLIFVLSSNVKLIGQEKIFSVGYGKTFITGDSSTFSFSIDLNRIPGRSETSGGYFINEVIGDSQWGYYFKPSMDINIGSSISSVPNNISIALPIGLSYDFSKLNNNMGIISLYIEGAPEAISDRSFKNFLYYFSLGTYIKYEFNASDFLFDFQTGISDANGSRNQKTLRNDYYGRFTIPLYFKITGWEATNNKNKSFRRIQFVNTLKYNIIYSDDYNLIDKKRYFYFNSKFDFYFTPNFGFNVMYNYGNEEPLFKKNNSLTFGITLAK